MAGILAADGGAANPAGQRAEPEDPRWVQRREAMVRLLREDGITNAAVLAAMAKVRRHLFIPESYRAFEDAYGDCPCPIGHRQTISQPYIVAYMTAKLDLRKGDKVLEIGTGSGYQAAVLAECGADVYSIEILPVLALHARSALDAEGYGRVRLLTGDGARGWPDYAPYNAIIVTCAPHEIPHPLKDQLADGGRLIAPVGGICQRLVIFRKTQGRIEEEEDLPVRFVPMMRDPAP